LALPSGRQTGLAGLAGYGGHKARGVDGAIQQRDAADEGRLDAYGSIIVGKFIVNGARSVRPSQLITSVRRTAANGK
jgi:hypothetical protein